MNGEIILRAKKLVDRIFKKIQPTKRYGEVIDKIAIGIKKEIKSNYHCSDKDIFGVFGKDDFFKTRLHKEEGKKLISRIASAICKKFKKVVITGRRIYYPRGNKVKTENNTINNLIDELKKEPQWGINFSKIMGLIPQSAIFLIDKDRSASEHEEGTFHEMDSILGLGVVIPHKETKGCKYFVKISIGKLNYHKCRSSDYSQCIKPKSRCLCKKLKINRTTIQPFIDKDSHLLVFCEDLKNIEKIVTEIISDYSKKFE